MNLIEFKYHTGRLVNMLKYRGFKTALNYFLVQALYNSNFIYEKIIYPFFPRTVFYPRFIEIEITTACNLRCKMCEHTYWKEKPKNMSFEQMKSIVDQFPNLMWIGLTGIGESFLNPDFVKMMRYVRDKNLILELYDNFYLIDEKISKELIDNKIVRMVVSLDAATKKTYEKIRMGSNFGRVMKNIKALIKLRKKMNSYYPEIMFHYIVSKDNMHEIIPYISLVKEIMNDEATSIFFTPILHPFKEIENLAIDIPENIIKHAESLGKELGIKVAWNRNASKEKEPIIKCNEWTEPFIFVDGKVIPCCAGNEANKRFYQKKTSMGNVFETPFKMIWNGQKYNALRKMIHNGKIPLACKYCTLYKV